MAQAGVRSASDEIDDIVRAARAQEQAAEDERIRLSVQIRTLSERRRGYAGLLVGATLVMLVSARLRGTVGALLFSVSSMLVIWGVVDIVRISNQCGTLKSRQRELAATRDAAADIVRRAMEV